MKLKIAILCTIIAIGAGIAALALPWYSTLYNNSNPTAITPTVREEYFWTDIITVTDPSDLFGNDTESYSSINLTNTAKTMNSCLSMTVIGLAFLIFLLLLQILGLCKRRAGFCTRCCVMIFAIIPIVFLMVGFFTLFNMPTALRNDYVCGYDITSGDGIDQYQCHSFQGSQSLCCGYTLSWGPYIGWWLCLCSIFFAIVSALCTLFSRRL